MTLKMDFKSHISLASFRGFKLESTFLLGDSIQELAPIQAFTKARAETLTREMQWMSKEKIEKREGVLNMKIKAQLQNTVKVVDAVAEKGELMKKLEERIQRIIERIGKAVVLRWDQKTERTIGIGCFSGSLRTVRRKNEDDKRGVLQIMMNSQGCFNAKGGRKDLDIHQQTLLRQTSKLGFIFHHQKDLVLSHF
ncbi:unnamed protein product [Vicia faba]|uniref:Uncharacterized protein n=1 Tax=Vicia faba TaxID=3906 RepID=A0AAV0ZPB7_VICFA|nr:unnamed protein product [Vicia faba]